MGVSGNSSSASSGIGVTGILTVIFVCAKGFAWEPVASWIWLWVLGPTLIPLGIVAFIVACMGVAYGLAAFSDWMKKR